MGPPAGAHCPHCQQRAPIVLRGIEARCAVCGGRRTPFGARSLNLAGTSSKVGGVAARILGWFVLGAGLSFGGALLLLLQWIASIWVGLAVGGPFILVGLIWGLALLLSGRKMGQVANDEKRAAQVETVRALAAHHRGAITARQAADALEISAAQADELLTEMAKLPSENVALELDDDGGIYYLFGGLGAEALRNDKWRFADAGADLRAEQEAEAEAVQAVEEQKRRQRR